MCVFVCISVKEHNLFLLLTLWTGFSKQTVQLLNERNVKYKTFDILTDDEVRQGQQFLLLLLCTMLLLCTVQSISTG